ncbi:chromobox protein 5 [Histomonas meleagridis]|uniref:chromobox protein-like 5 n=1 Tax=Histomonas meleagridis TaxID=135588 RepID=UPI00355A3FBB|nr:chromobox protein 5 [Histomonas meleagridis]KAH0801622.1 chromobox protein-like 5 [Histomonas meleagridis]
MEFLSFLSSLENSGKEDNDDSDKSISSSSESENYDNYEEESAEEYEVEAIVNDRIVHRRRQFLLKWKGYPDSENTWEDEKNLNCPELVKEYLKKKKEKQNVLPPKMPPQEPALAPTPSQRAPLRSSTLFKLTPPKPIKKPGDNIEKIIKSQKTPKGWVYTVKLKDSSNTSDVHSTLLKKICPDIVLNYLETKILKTSP